MQGLLRFFTILHYQAGDVLGNFVLGGGGVSKKVFEGGVGLVGWGCRFLDFKGGLAQKGWDSFSRGG